MLKGKQVLLRALERDDLPLLHTLMLSMLTSFTWGFYAVIGNYLSRQIVSQRTVSCRPLGSILEIYKQDDT